MMWPLFSLQHLVKHLCFGIMIRKLLMTVSACSALVLSGCSSLDVKDDKLYPGTQEEQRREKIGSLTGQGGFNLFGGNSEKSDDSGPSVGIGINSYLWRASLDTLSFMPLASADPFGGVLITDWYENPDARGERFKMTVTILSRKLSSDAVKVAVFKQKYSRKHGWQDQKVVGNVARDLEDKILTRARQLRVSKSTS